MPDYAGIDYGMGKTNVDMDTGIRFGVISLNSLGEYAIEGFEADYGTPTCPKCGNEAETIPAHTESDPTGEGKWVSVVQGVPDEMENWEGAKGFCEFACRSCKYLFESSEAYNDDPLGHILDDFEYKAVLDEYNDVFLMKSPYYTHAQFCSPCAPGAGHLGNPCESGPKTYCFGHDWFDGEKAPYPVYRVSDDTQVASQ